MESNLKAARKRADLTQEGLAELAGVPQSNISRYERGGLAFVDDALKLAAALGSTVEALFSSNVTTEKADDNTGPVPSPLDAPSTSDGVVVRGKDVAA